MTLAPFGPAAWLVLDVVAPASWAAALRELAVPGVLEIVPAESTVVVRCLRDRHEEIGRMLDGVEAPSARVDAAPVYVIDVVYDGPDLDELADIAGMSAAEVVRLHSSGSYEVAFCGFSPGFGYLRGVDQRLHVPRRSTPRTSVPAGSVGVAAGYSCVYPSASPGGWYLIGQTAAVMWDSDRDPPAVLHPGRAVRFRSVRG